MSRGWDENYRIYRLEYYRTFKEAMENLEKLQEKIDKNNPFWDVVDIGQESMTKEEYEKDYWSGWFIKSWFIAKIPHSKRATYKIRWLNHVDDLPF